MTAPHCNRCGLDRTCTCFKPVACMGGMCAKRGACPHYHAEDRSEPVERLCTRGKDGDSVQRQGEMA